MKKSIFLILSLSLTLFSCEESTENPSSETFYIPFVDVNADLIINEQDKVIINDEGDMGYRVKDNLNMDIFIGAE